MYSLVWVDPGSEAWHVLFPQCAYTNACFVARSADVTKIVISVPKQGAYMYCVTSSIKLWICIIFFICRYRCVYSTGGHTFDMVH